MRYGKGPDAKSVHSAVRFTLAEHLTIKAYAQMNDMTYSDAVRKLILERIMELPNIEYYYEHIKGKIEDGSYFENNRWYDENY